MTAKERPTERARIIQDPDVLAGKPVVKGTRIAVELVLDYLANNPNFDELFADYPRLTIDDVKACLAFAQAAIEEGGKTRAHGDDLPAVAPGP